MKVYLDITDETIDLTKLAEDTRENILDLSGKDLLARVTKKTPVDQGTAKQSWDDGYKKEENQVTIQTNIKYMPFLEEGTGLYGPKKKVIRPLGEGYPLKWKPTKNSNYKAGPDGFCRAMWTRGQKPVHMVRDSILELEQKIPSLAKIAIQNALKE